MRQGRGPEGWLGLQRRAVGLAFVTPAGTPAARPPSTRSALVVHTVSLSGELHGEGLKAHCTEDALQEVVEEDQADPLPGRELMHQMSLHESQVARPVPRR